MIARRMLALVLLLAAPLAAKADGPLFGWGQHNCPRSDYSPMHYWFWGYYEGRAFFRPVYIDQYPPGPSPPVPLNYDMRRYPCPPITPTPGTPYIDPDGYFGRPVVVR